MDAPSLFISYSRTQFYFVESLAHQLRTLKVPYWFDVEQLEMGEDWQAGIDNGLANCEALVLVVSNASIGSPNVKYEWDAAKKANKPVYLALFEAVNLPPELSHLPIIDFRGNFKRGVKHLVALFQKDYIADSAIRSPKPNRFKLPTRLPRDILIVFLTLLTIAAGSLVAAMLLAPLSLSLTVLFLIIAIGYGNFCRMFITRRYIHPEIASAFLLSLLISVPALLLLAVSNTAPPDMHPPTGVETALLVILFGLMVAGSLYSLFAMGHSSAIFRWCPLGPVPPYLRDRTLHIRRKRHVKFTPMQKSYSLSYAPADRRVSEQVQRAMSKAFYSEIPVGEGTADHNLVVLSNATPVTLFEAHANELKKPISVMASSIRNAAPDEKELRAVTRFQWVDHRNRRPDNLINMVEILWLEDSGQQVSAADYHIIPESFRQPIIPFSIFIVVNLWRLLAAAVGSFNVFQLVGLLLPNDHFLHQVAPRSLDVTVLMAIQIVLCVFLLWLCVQITQRSINFSTSLLGLVASVLVILVIPLLIAQLTIPGLLSDAGRQIRDIDQFVVGGSILILVFVVAFLCLWALRGLYRWLPLSNEPLNTSGDPTLRQAFGRLLWRNNLAFVFIFGTVMLALIEVNFDLATRTEQIDHLRITMPRLIVPVPIQNGDISTIVLPAAVPSTFKAQIQRFVNAEPHFGTLQWVGAFWADPALQRPIPLVIWRYQPLPADSESMVDQFVQSAPTVPTNLVRSKITNASAVIDVVTYDFTSPASPDSPASADTLWMVAAHGQQYSYVLVVAAEKQPMLRAGLVLTQIIKSITIH